jgi:hypothetical protein
MAAVITMFRLVRMLGVIARENIILKQIAVGIILTLLMVDAMTDMNLSITMET